MSYCYLCGAYHDTAACPPFVPSEPSTAVPSVTAFSVGNVSLNGLSLGEHQIIEKLDEIIKLLRRQA